ncbi:MAG: acyl-CoA reductase [Saprospiraceae bacterium]
MSDSALSNRLDALAKLGDYIRSKPELLDAYVQRSSHHNGWFTTENQWRMLDTISEDYLDRSNLEAWANAYAISDTVSSKSVGLVLAGNIPLVGFHDWLSVMVAGTSALVKLSDKDPYVLPHLVEQLEKIDPSFVGKTRFVERLKDYHAVIATGSDNTARYFKQYFGHVPHIIRGNRTSIAVVHGNETEEELRGLADDVFAYFGLGCRSVGKIYVPSGYVFEPLLEILHEYKRFANHTKWKNNFDYNYAMLTINREAFLGTGSILLLEAPSLHSRLATLHYEQYEDLANVAIDLSGMEDALQAIVSAASVGALEVSAPGTGQRPGLSEYADGVDVMAFLTGLA